MMASEAGHLWDARTGIRCWCSTGLDAILTNGRGGRPMPCQESEQKKRRTTWIPTGARQVEPMYRFCAFQQVRPHSLTSWWHHRGLTKCEKDQQCYLQFTEDSSSIPESRGFKLNILNLCLHTLHHLPSKCIYSVYSHIFAQDQISSHAHVISPKINLTCVTFRLFTQMDRKRGKSANFGRLPVTMLDGLLDK